MKIRLLPFFFLLTIVPTYSQFSNAAFSPYSLFGLGKFNDFNTGITNSIGRAGVALESKYEINGLNPASLGGIGKHSFFFDIGSKGEYTIYRDENRSGDNRALINFSNISLAFSLGKKSGLSLSLIPYTEVGYFFRGIITDVEGATTNSLSTIEGGGGLNNFNVSYGKAINDKLSLGLAVKFFFGSIEQIELVQLQQDCLQINDVNNYKGLKFETGFQLKVNERTSLGGVFSLPATLRGSRNRSVIKIIDGQQSLLENTGDIQIDDYSTPFDFTLGVKHRLNHVTLFTDYKRTFWSSTNIVDDIGNYTDSNILGIGMEYSKRTEELSFGKKPRFRYRLGFNYDDGNLRVNNKKISNTFITAGMGIPIGRTSNTYLNIAYSFGSKGVVSNTLVRENYHSLSLNLSFEELWFIKRLID